MNGISRRSFLKDSALGAAAVALTGEAAHAANTSAVEEPATLSATFRLTRELPIEDSFDLVVAGGGAAGTAAAVSAARLGAKVLLAEATGCLGGMGTSGFVTEFGPMANGERMLVGGLMREIVTTLDKRGQLAPHVTPDFYTKRYHVWTPFHIEGYKLLLDELVVSAGVDMRFFTRVVEADVDPATRTVRGVILHNVEGMRYIRARAFVDATGDAVMADLCGAHCREAGRDTPNINPATLCSLVGGIDWKRARADASAGNPNPDNPANQQALVEKAIAEGHFPTRDPHVPGMYQVDNNLATLNIGHVFHMNALRCRSLSDGIMQGRRQVPGFVEFYRQYVPGCEKIELGTTAPLLGVRESRRIVGEYELNFNDYISQRHFPDQIGVYNRPCDVHEYDDSPEEYERFKKQYELTGRLKPGESFGIPYGILVPQGWHNLWVAGRCNSSDIKVAGAVRSQPASSMMGQAAGTAAVQSIRTGQPACDLDTAQLVESLRKTDAYLPQEALSRRMTRATA
jgi:hypothetical protein